MSSSPSCFMPIFDTFFHLKCHERLERMISIQRHFFCQSHEYQFVVLLISLNVVWQKNSSSCSLTLYWNLICAECTSVQISISRWFREKVAWSCWWVLLFYPKIFSRWLVNGLHYITFRQCWLIYNLQIIYVLSSQKGLHRLARGA